MSKGRQLKLDLLGNSNHTLLDRVKIMAIHLRIHTKTTLADANKLAKWKRLIHKPYP